VLAKADPNKFGVAVCSVDGQRWSRGDTKQEFGVQSCMKPLNYAIALETRGYDKVFQHIGIEPSGMAFNEMALDRRRVEDETGTAVPHNPLINAGAIMCCSLIEEGRSVARKLDTVLSYWRRLTGGESPCNIDEDMYRSESATANRNRCLAYMMNEAGAFPEGAALERELEFYFMCCSQLQDAETMSIVAGTLANGGVSPVTNDRIFSPQTVQSVLSVMFTCGMYDYSGQFSFTMGFPSKSGVAGACLIVVPNVMGGESGPSPSFWVFLGGGGISAVCLFIFFACCWARFVVVCCCCCCVLLFGRCFLAFYSHHE
jgi:glutaminase